jgi:hypothetical protein
MAEQQALPDEFRRRQVVRQRPRRRSRIAPRTRHRFYKSAAQRVEYIWKQHRGVLRFITLVTKLPGAFLNYDIKVI